MTEFCHAEVPLWDGLSFHIDGNSKITNSLGSYLTPAPNAFSLPHVSSCPGSTPICRASCYVHGLEQHAKEVHDLYRLNAAALDRALISDKTALYAAAHLGNWIEENCAGGFFRWHVSGDVKNLRHAEWIVDVCSRTPSVRHWIYTRSWWAGYRAIVDELLSAENLAVNLSIDAHNIATAWHMFSEELRTDHDGTNPLRACYLANGDELPWLPAGSVIFPDYPFRGRTLPEPTNLRWWQERSADEKRMICPADFFGQSEQHRCGPCRKCMVRG